MAGERRKGGENKKQKEGNGRKGEGKRTREGNKWEERKEKLEIGRRE